MAKENGRLFIRLTIPFASSAVNVSRTQLVFVLAQPYFVAMVESGNIFRNSGTAWSAQGSGRLCSTMNSVNKASARMMSVKNCWILRIGRLTFPMLVVCFVVRMCFSTSPILPWPMLNSQWHQCARLVSTTPCSDGILLAQLLILWSSSMELIVTDTSWPIDVSDVVLCTTEEWRLKCFVEPTTDDRAYMIVKAVSCCANINCHTYICTYMLNCVLSTILLQNLSLFRFYRRWLGIVYVQIQTFFVNLHRKNPKHINMAATHIARMLLAENIVGQPIACMQYGSQPRVYLNICHIF